MLYVLFRLWDFGKYVILIFKESDRGSNPKYIACIGNDGSYCNVAIIGFFPQVCQEEELVCRFVIMEYLAVIGVGVTEKVYSQSRRSIWSSGTSWSAA